MTAAATSADAGRGAAGDAARAIRVGNFLFDDRIGGPQRRVIAVAARLRERGIDTLMVLPQGDGNAAAAAHAAGVAVARVPFARPAGRGLALLGAGLRVLPDAVRLALWLRRTDLDLMHVNGAMFLAPAIAARLAGRRLVWHLNDTMVRQPLAWLLGRIVAGLAHRVVVAADAVARHYGVKGAHPVVIHAPVDTERFRPRAEAGQGARPLAVGLVGNWNPVKGIEDFLAAAATVAAARGSAVVFVLAGARLAGHAGYAAGIERRIATPPLAGRVRALGFVEDAAAMVAGLDLLVLASLSEASPMAVLEAMACAVPVVATDVGGVREILAPEAGDAAGVVVPRARPDRLAAEILALLDDPARRRRLGAAGRARAEREFSLARCAERHRALYRGLVAS